MKRQRMRKGPPSKSGSDGDELLMTWLTRMLDEEKLEGLRWEDKPRRKFRIAWTHRSAEKWSERDVEVQKAWAIHKGNNIDLSVLDKKSTDPATLKAKSTVLKKIKATFRCALNSKKELHLYSKTKTHRYWEILDSSTVPVKPKVQKKRKSKLATDQSDEEMIQYFDREETTTQQIQCENVTSSSFNATSSTDIHENVYTMQDVHEINDTCSPLPAFSSFNEGYNPVTPPNQVTDWEFQATEPEDVSSTFETRSLLTPPSDQTLPADEAASPTTLTYWSDSTHDTLSAIAKFGDKVLAKCENVPSEGDTVVKTYQVLNTFNSDLEEFLQPFMNSSNKNVKNTSSKISSNDISSSCGTNLSSVVQSQSSAPEAADSYPNNTSNTSFSLCLMDTRQEENVINGANILSNSQTPFKILPSLLKQTSNCSNYVSNDPQISSNSFINTYSTSTINNSYVFQDCFSTINLNHCGFDSKSTSHSSELYRKEKNHFSSSSTFSGNDECADDLFLNRLIFSRSCDYNLQFT